MIRSLISAILLCSCQTSTTFAQDEPEDFPPGLLAKYSVGDQTVETIDYDLSFRWENDAPDERLPAKPFVADWQGNLLLRLPGQHRFYADVSGDLTIEVDDDVVLQATNARGFIAGPPVDLRAGDHTIRVRYRSPNNGDPASMSLFWASDRFTLEPIPADVLFRDEPSKVWAADQGRILTDAFRCGSCHQNSQSLQPLAAPALDRIHGSQSRKTLIARLQQPTSVVSNSHMPHFGLTKSEAVDVAAFLSSVSKKAQSTQKLSFKPDDVSAGQLLLNSLGCVACHQVNANPSVAVPAEPYDAPELVHFAKRRSAAWLDRWMRDPASLNVDHRMPVFELDKDERRQLVAALTNGNATDESEPLEFNNGSIEAGRALVQSANCAACHRIPKMESTKTAPSLAQADSQSGSSCLAALQQQSTTERKRRPHYSQLSDERQDRLQAWIESKSVHSKTSAMQQGQTLLQRNGCTACHDRDLTRGLSGLAGELQKAHPDLNGRSQGLVPPSLTAVGDKLLDDYLHLAVAGEQKQRRLPWLLVRMPKFRHSPAERELIKQYFRMKDRIPDAADLARQDVLTQSAVHADTTATPQQLLLGNQLTGAGGFNCVACHKAGPFEPRNVALGTRGSDLMTMRERIRPRFFLRWMKNPIRVVPGIEMPAIKKAIPDVLEGSLPQQIAAIWTALRDPNFTPPTVTSRFEQVVNVTPDEPPRMIRDVFTIGLDKDRQAVARALAVGFGNGHNLLLDLDNMALRLWTVGEFARQRTEGKSWYWDMPGLVQYQSEEFTPPTLTIDGRELVAIEDEGRLAELLEYSNDADSVQWKTAWYFGPPELETSASKEPHFAPTNWDRHAASLTRIETLHELRGVSDDTQAAAGWQHRITVLNAPPKSVLKLNSLFPEQSQLQASVPVDVRSDVTERSIAVTAKGNSASATETVLSDQTVLPARRPLPKPPLTATAEQLTSTPGFLGTRLPILTNVMPTAMTWLPDGRLAFTSLKGHVWIANDSTGDGVPDRLQLFEEGLAAPFGIIHDNGDLIVSHKPEILRLRDENGDGRADVREVVAAGWGYNDNYHDWTSGLVRDDEGHLYVGLGSDYSQKKRPMNQDRWRGGVIKIDPSGIVTPLAMSMRYPMGLAFDSQGRLFATDNQGVQNTFNEINHILPGRHYGVPSTHQPTDELQHETPALMVPHPWTRSVNSIVFLPDHFPVEALRGHGIGCEYDSRFLIRFTVQEVNGTLQGASYRFSLPEQEAGGSNFIGPMCSAVSPEGELYIGSIWDSGWQGGLNTGGISRLVPAPDGLPNGIREVRAMEGGFEVEFFQPVDASLATAADHWSLQGYTREWGGSYATPDSGRYAPTINDITVVSDRVVHLRVSELKAGFLYTLSAQGELAEHHKLWPSEAHYSMKVVPQDR